MFKHIFRQWWDTVDIEQQELSSVVVNHCCYLLGMIVWIFHHILLWCKIHN